MARYYQRPENALKKANEFIEAGKPTRALDTLYDVIKGKKHRAFSEKVIEPIMLKYLELCVELKKPHTAKEGLYQYRLMCQAVNVGLLEKVIRSFIRMAEERTELARDNIKNKVSLEQSTQAVVEVDDLDNVSMADMTLLNVVTEEQAQERSERAALIPWVKFLWESYTQCLDLLRNNARLENFYHDIAQMAFKFCLSYNRKTEFRKLCERLRKHFDDVVNRASTQMNSIDFSSPETQQLNMETRLAQLDSAITMELWQEAYKAIEDIHLLMNQSKKSQTRMMAYYYQKLSLVFWKAGNLLFHAATMLKYYMLCKDMKKNVSQEELQRNASQVVLATLAIKFPVSHPEFERFVETDKGMMEKAQKLATLLFLPQPPTRSSLIRDLSRFSVLSNAIPPLQKLHDILETEFNPLGLCNQVNEIVKEVMSNEENEYLQQYVEPLHDVALVRLIKQVAQVYQSIDYNHLLDMTVFTTESHLEQLLVDAVRYNDMQITIDHRSNCVKFGSSLAEASREDLPEGPHLQDMPSEVVRLQLVNVFNCFEETLEMINPSHLIHDEENLRMKIVNHYMMHEKQNHIKTLGRQKIIADRREELERTAAYRENEEKWRNEQILKQQQIMEAKRLETERQERENRRIETERANLHKMKIRDRVNQIASTRWGQSVVGKMDESELDKLDVDTIMQRQQEELAKEAREHQARMVAQAKRLDHLERAKRIEDIPVIEKYMKEKKEQEKEEWEIHERERITHLIEDRKVAVVHRERMTRMQKDKDIFLQGLLQARRHVFEAKLADFEEKFAKERAKRLQERKDQRREDRRRKYFEEKEEEERRRQEEERREQDRIEKEERDRIQREVDERNRVTEEKQRQRQKEIEEKEMEREKQRKLVEPQREPERSSGGSIWRRGGGSGSMPRAAASASGASAAPATTTPASDAERVAPAGGKWVPPSLKNRVVPEEGEEEVMSKPPPRVEREFGGPQRTERDRDMGRDREIGRERDVGREMGRERDAGREMGRERDAGREMGRERDAGREMGRERDAGREMGREREAGRELGRRPDFAPAAEESSDWRRVERGGDKERNFARGDRDNRGFRSENQNDNRRFDDSRGFDRENRNFEKPRDFGTRGGRGGRVQEGSGRGDRENRNVEERSSWRT